MVPPAYRKRISSVTSTGYNWASQALSLGGKTLWVVSTSALLLGVPWALAFSEEQQVQEMEKEMRMQQSANDVCSAFLGGTWDGLALEYDANVCVAALNTGHRPESRWCEACPVMCSSSNGKTHSTLLRTYSCIIHSTPFLNNVSNTFVPALRHLNILLI